ncbi:MAG: hypothetical protein ACR5K9_07405 [Wolbachia sp.]
MRIGQKDKEVAQELLKSLRSDLQEKDIDSSRNVFKSILPKTNMGEVKAEGKSQWYVQ